MDVFCEFSYVMESISFDTPPDDFDVQEMSLDLHILKHPRYAWALNPYVTDASTFNIIGATKVYYVEVKEAIIRMIQTYIDSPFFPSMNQVNGLVQTNIINAIENGTFQIHWANPNFQPIANGTSAIPDPVAWDGHSAYPTTNCAYFLLTLTKANLLLSDHRDAITIALAAAKEIISKLWRQEDTPYIAGYKVIWTQKVFSTVYLNCGGYIEDPRQIVPQYFMNPFNNGVIPRSFLFTPYNGYIYDESAPNSNPGSASIFDLLPIINPQCYSVTGRRGGPLSFSCLRTTDTIRFDRTFFDITHSWTCSTVGHFDYDLYNQGDRPQNANDYNRLPY
jgi:hypothetical protein